MASAIDRSDTFGADIVDSVLLIETDQIEEGERLRPVDRVHAEALGQLMRRDGQKKSIEVCRLPGANRWTLVDGAHRLAGAKLAGIAYLRAEVVSADAQERRLREIWAQLGHRGLSDPIDRAAFIAKLVQIKREQAGLAATDFRDASVKKAISAEADQTLETISNVYGWTEEVGAQLGFTGRTVRNDLLIYRRLPPSFVEQLRDARHPVAGNATQLRALAKLEGQTLRRVVAKLLDGARSVAEALATVANTPAPDPEAKRLAAFIGAFGRMGLAERKGALAHLAELLPAGFAIVEGERLRKAEFPAEHARYRDEALEAIDTMRELVDGIVEDEAVTGERLHELDRANRQLGLARFTIAGDGFNLGAGA